MSATTKIFYSYSHADAELRNELDKHLSTLKRNKVIDAWFDGEISAGTEWEEQIFNNLNTADIILLLVSADFLASDFINQVELERAIERHNLGEARVIPVILRHCDWQDLHSKFPIGNLQALPKDAKPIATWADQDEAFLNVVDGIKAAIKDLAAQPSEQIITSLPEKENIFVGREVILDSLIDRLTSDQLTALSSEGKGGVGKTTLALEIAKHPKILNHFSDGVLWLSLGQNPQMELKQNIWAHNIDIDLSGFSTLEKRRKALKSAINDRKMLLIIDDVWELENAEYLKCGGENCCHFLTTRDEQLARRFAGTENVEKIQTLSNDYAYELFKHHAPQITNLQTEESRKLCDSLGGLPLAIVLVAAYLENDSRRHFDSGREQSLQEISKPSKRLQLAKKRIESTHSIEQTLEECINLSLESLSQETRSVFYSFGSFAAKPASFSLEAAMHVGQTDESQIGRLIDCNLLDSQNETLSMHQVVADVARSKPKPEDYIRHSNFYLEQINQDESDWKRIQKIYPQIDFAATYLENQDSETYFEFFDALKLYHNRQGLVYIEFEWCKKGLDISQKLNDRHWEVSFIGYMGIIQNNLGNTDESLRLLLKALEIETEIGKPLDIANVLTSLGLTYQGGNELDEALKQHKRSLTLMVEVGDKPGEGTVRNNLGGIYWDLGKNDKALEFFEEALNIRREVRDKSGESITLNNIGGIYYALGNYVKAMQYFEKALPLSIETGNIRFESTIRRNVAMIYYLQNSNHKAIDELELAIKLFEKMGHPDLEEDKAFLDKIKQETK